MGAGGIEGYRGIVIEDVCECDMPNLGGSLVFMLMRAGILVVEVMVVAVGVMVVIAVGAISFSEKWCLPVMEVKYLGVDFGLVGGDILDLGRGFVAVVVEMEVNDWESEVGAVVRLVWNCLNGRLYFLW